MSPRDFECGKFTFTSFVIVKSPKISPVITRALLILEASVVSGGRMASPVYSCPSVEMNRTKRWALIARGNNKSNDENHILGFLCFLRLLQEIIYPSGGT